MKNSMIQTAIYPTPAPVFGVTIIDEDKLAKLVAVCEKLNHEETVSAPTAAEIEEHFQIILQLTDPTYHVEIVSEEPLSMTQKIWQQLESTFPQFAWFYLKETQRHELFVYYISFIPLATTQRAFPFEMNFGESVLQQFELNDVKPMVVAEEKITTIINDIQTEARESGDDTVASEEPEEPTVEVDETQSEAENVADETTVEVSDDVTTVEEDAEPEEAVIVEEEQVPDAEEVIETQEQESSPEMVNRVRALEKELKQEKLKQRKVKNANKKLEVLIDQLEHSLIANSVSYFGEVDPDDDDWDKILKIDLREYTYLIQKTKYLEQMWQMNGKLLNRSERMTLSNDRITYERSQVDEIKNNFSANEISFALYESQMIEQRVKVKARKFFGFGKPHVKIMKMDYDNLVSKAAYFDLLQGETIILEKIARDAED